MKITSNTLKGAVQGGHYDTAKWIIDLGIKPDSDTIDYIIGDDQFDWLIAVPFPQLFLPNVMIMP